MLDFQTGADVAKAEQEGEVVYYGHDSEPGIGVLLDSFKKDFPKIKTSYVRLQTGALYAKITAERSAGRFGVDVLQLSDISPAIDFQKKGGWELYPSPEYAGYKAEYQSSPSGYYGWGGVSFAGISYNKSKVPAGQAPKAWKDINNPAFKDGISAKLATSGMQHAQWYMLRKLYGNDFWTEFAKQRPRGFDSRAQLFDRLSKGDDRVCALAEYAGYTLFQEKGADIDFVAPPDGMPATSALHRGGQPRPPPRGGQALRGLGPLQARPDGLPEPEDPALRVAAERRGADAHRQAAVGLQAPVPLRLGRLRGQPLPVREGVELDHGAVDMGGSGRPPCPPALGAPRGTRGAPRLRRAIGWPDTGAPRLRDR